MEFFLKQGKGKKIIVSKKGRLVLGLVEDNGGQKNNQRNDDGNFFFILAHFNIVNSSRRDFKHADF